MGKIFGLLACIGTAALVSGCVKAPAQRDFAAEVRAKNKNTMETIERQLRNSQKTFEEAKKLVKDLQSCQKPEAKQEISAEAEANAVSAEIVAEVQDTNVVNAQCNGKNVLTEKRAFEAFGLLTIAGPVAISEFTSVEVESDRTCAKLSSSTIVADVSQSQIRDTVVQANGNVRIGLSNSLWKTGIALPVMAGKNLLKVRYTKCVGSTEVTNEDGTVSTVCDKVEVVAEKELVLNVTIKQNVIDGVRTEEGCPKKEDSIE